MNPVCSLSIYQLRSAIKRKDLSVREVAEAFLRRTEEVDGRLRSFVTVAGETLLTQAKETDDLLSRGDIKLGFLTGIPLAIKDNITTKGLRTTCASKILENYVPPYDATVIRRLRRDRALILGKTNCDEFAMGSSTENSAFFPTRNPWNLERVPGGSSGGSAAAVAARLVPGALGSDTGGSIRQPAAFCGTIGLKPTYGRLSRFGLVAFGSSLDQIGPIANTTRDLATIFQVVAGWDRKDSTSANRSVEDYLGEMGKGVRGLRVGIPPEWFSSGLDPVVGSAVRGAVNRLQGLGCELEEVHLPHTEYAIATYYIIAPAEASSNLARYDGVKYGYRSANLSNLEEMYRKTRSEGFGDEVKRRIMIGTYALSSGYYDAYFLKASKVRTLIKEDYLKAFEKVDLLAGPTTPTLPFRLGEKTADPLEMYLSDVYTVTANLAGIPGLSMPCGFSDEGLPIGLQLLGPHFQEGRLLRAAHALEVELDLHPHAPEV
jgi:aspartyl-tRNA(Asn)/glutamyl-tRNA(Gln) amidotransferase subunit A